MSKWDKLLKKILALSQDIRFEELKKVLESYGYDVKTPAGGSSHYVFRKEGRSSITIPKHKPVKKVYIKLVRDAVLSEVEND